MAHAESGKHDATAFVFGNPPSSRPQVQPANRGAATGVLGAVIWAVGLALGSLGNAVVFLDSSALERWSKVFDGPGWSWASAVSGYAIIVSSTRLILPNTSNNRFRPISLLALFAWTYHLLLLRWPWLITAVAPPARLSVYSGALSQSWESLPIYAFGELLACALLFTHATLYLLSAAQLRGWLSEDGSNHRARSVLVSTALGFYFLSAAVTICLATGRV